MSAIVTGGWAADGPADTAAEGSRDTADRSRARPLARIAPVRLGVWFGLLAGLGEGVYVLLKGRVLSEPVGGFPEANAAVIWTTPLALAATFALMGLVLAGAGRVWRRFPAALAAVALFTGLLVQTWLMVPGRLMWWAAVLLSLGAAVQAVRTARPRLPAFVTYVRKSIVRGLALVAALAAVQMAAGPLRARLHLNGAPQPPSPVNLLLVVLDTERADRLGLYGYERPTSPELERLAQSAVMFESAYAPSSWTFPTHASLFTGRLHAGHGLGIRFRNPLDERETTLAEVLRDAGYNTAAFAANMLYANPQLGLAQGFLQWSGLRVTPRTAWLSAWLNRWIALRYRALRGNPPSLFLRDADSINREFLGWLERRSGDRPFFAFLNYFDPHAPYGAPAPFAGMFRPGSEPLWLTKGTGARRYTDAERAAMSAAYDEELAYLDNRIGALFDELEERGILDRTVVIITSDHGEQFGEHGSMDHGQNLYSTLTRVPLLVRLPRGEHGGLRVAEPVGLLDVGATMLEAAGVTSNAIGGRSLSPFWAGGASPGPVYAYLDGYGKALRSVYHRGWLYIEDAFAPAALYYLPDDPEETNDVATAQPAVVADLARLLEGAFGASGRGAAAGAPAHAGAGAAGQREQAAEQRVTQRATGPRDRPGSLARREWRRPARRQPWRRRRWRRG